MIQATTAIVLDKRVQRKNGTYAVKLRVTHNRDQKYYPLKTYLTEEDWLKCQANNCRGDYKEKKIFFNGVENRAVEIVKKLQPFTFQAFERNFNAASKPVDDVFSLFESYINDLERQNRHGYAALYRTSLNSFKSYLKDGRKTRLRFEEITPAWLAGYEKWYLSGTASISTVGIYLRNLRYIINLAINDGQFPKDLYPFGKRKYQIPAGRNVKKALTLTQLKSIIDYKPANEAEERWRDLWVFSYLCNGANLKDLARLKYKNISTSSITFIRTKTERSSKKDQKPIVVMLLPEIVDIINRWGVEPTSPETYVFGMIDESQDTLKQFKRIQQTNKTMNKYVKRIGTSLGIDINLTTYVARHSFATVLKRSGAPTAFISESLGHKNTKTTDNYLDSFESDVKELYQKQLLNFDSSSAS